jgi:hypothetical protein
LAFVAFTAMVIATAGCSSSNGHSGRIRLAGSVSCDGKPLDHGSVLFARVSDHDVASSPIRPGGRFMASLLPGDYDIAVRCVASSTTSEATVGWAEPKSLIPEKYGDAKTSGLRVTAAAGMQPIRLDLSRSSEPAARPIAR